MRSRKPMATCSKIRAGGWALLMIGVAGCHPFPVSGRFQGEAKVDAEARVAADATVRGSVEVKVPPAPDPGPMTPVVVRASGSGPSGPRVGLIDVDGLLLN